MEKISEQFTGFQWGVGYIDKNRIKHNGENWECEQIFFNSPLIVLDDAVHSVAEKRWVAFGKTDQGRFLVILFTERKNLIRIISARDMNKREKEFYNEK
ncbi:MAG: BrnT family toxin [Desulfobacteraceae bacterium]|nr:BrnT family toxin [Desulfobacteraceae bacterium]MBU4054029.1 BrnT family toxin [Pseudomonadota bacterium]